MRDWPEPSRAGYEELKRELNEARRQQADTAEMLKEARRQQAATSLVLKVMSGSKFDLDPVLLSLLQSARDLCNAEQGMIHLRDGDLFPCIAQVGWPAAFEHYMRDHPITTGRHSVIARVALTGSVVHVPDVLADAEYRLSEGQKLGNYRAVLGVPLLRDGKVIGAFALGRPVPMAFVEREIELVQTFADQAVIAIENVRLFDEVEARTRDLGDALQQQTATADVLKVISRSAFDLQSVLDTLVQSAARLCDADMVSVNHQRDDVYRQVAQYGQPPELMDYLETHPIRLGRGTTVGRTVLEGRPVQIPDLLEDPDFQFVDAARAGGVRTSLGVPLLREDVPIGVMVLQRRVVKPFTEKQIALVQSFADQAVIAIENVRLFSELQERNRETSEALQQQTATAEVLKVISRSAFDLDMVLTTLLQSALSLCRAPQGNILLPNGEGFRPETQMGMPEAFLQFMRENPITPGSHSVVARVALTGSIVHVPDVLADPEYRLSRAQELGGFRAVLGVPMIRESEVVGIFTLCRPVPEPFTQREIELVQTFSDQALIAIENVRLFEEVNARTRDLGEALQQQTATANVLKVISRSTFDLPTVLETLTRSAAELCDADRGSIFQRHGETYRPVTSFRFPPEWMVHGENHPVTPSPDTVTGRVLLEQRPVHHPDVLSVPNYAASEYQRIGRYRSILGLPLLREGEPVGVFILTRDDVRPFTERQIELVQSFADQAVIAIENVRLFEEVNARTRDLTEALQQQTATADVLKVISRSTFDLKAVLSTLVESARALCNAPQGMILMREGEFYRTAMQIGYPPEFEQYILENPIRPSLHSGAGRAALTREVAHFPDVLADPDYRLTDGQRLGGYRTMLSVPLLREGEVVGVFSLGRTEPEAFTPRQIELVQTFADQAVIAIENVRLFEEVNARTRDLTEALQQQTATADVLKIISRSAFDLQTVLDTLVRSAARYCDADRACIFRKEGDLYQCVSTVGFSPEWVAYAQQRPLAAGSRSGAGRVASEGRAVHIHDVLADPDYDAKEHQRLGKYRTLLGVPLLREGAPIGVFILTRGAVRPFDERQIEVVQTFADQAGIAIEDVRLFQEVQARTDELARSLNELRSAQNRLVQTEKLASLGQLTAGIAHEIKNPLNFVNNFSSLSADLVDELREILGPAPLAHEVRQEVEEVTGMLKGNLEKVVQHGKRADSIVKNMLLHSREGSGERHPTDVNALVEESLNLAYHGARAEKPGFNVTLRKELDPAAGEADLYAQEITRVLLNLISNGFHATSKRKAEGGDAAFEPTVVAATRDLDDRVEIRIRDNGTGIPEEVRAKIFNPFFTTKPAGEGTGLGLSLSQDIVVKQHGGTIDVATSSGSFTEFTITLPRSSFLNVQRRSGG